MDSDRQLHMWALFFCAYDINVTSSKSCIEIFCNTTWMCSNLALISVSLQLPLSQGTEPGLHLDFAFGDIGERFNLLKMHEVVMYKWQKSSCVISALSVTMAMSASYKSVANRQQYPFSRDASSIQRVFGLTSEITACNSKCRSTTKHKKSLCWT